MRGWSCRGDLAILIPIEADGLALPWVCAIMCEIALASDQIQLAIAIHIHQRRRMRLRPGVINNVLYPLPVRGLFIPRKPIIVGHSGEQILAAITVDVDEIHVSERRTAFRRSSSGCRLSRSRPSRCNWMLIPVGWMEDPVARRTHISRSFKPPLRGQNIVPAIAVYIANADAMPIASL